MSNHTRSAALGFSRDAERLIARFRGLPEAGWVPRGRPAVAIGSLIEKLEETYRIGQPGIEETIMSNWRTLVGDRIAQRCRPGKIIGKSKLIILASNPVIRQELNFQRASLLRKIVQLPGCAGISEVSIHNA